jgi:putative transposase
MGFVWNRVEDEVAPWWKENSKEVYSAAFSDLEQGLKNYFDSRSGKRKGEVVGWPRFKSRKARQSVTFTTGAIKVIDPHHVQLPKIGVLRVKESTDKLRLPVKADTARILRATLVTEGGKTFVCFGVIVQHETHAQNLKGVAGCDVGIHFIVRSSEERVLQNPRAEKAQRKRISRYQRRLNRQHRVGSPACCNPDGTHKGGVCYWKDRSRRAKENQARLAKAHAKTARVPEDTIHKATHRASTTFAVNVIEDLNVRGMGRKGYGKRGFNRALKDSACGEFRRQMSYKCRWSGSSLWLANRWYASSKLCSQCGAKKANLKLSERVFQCDNCGLVIDRDLNAAKNLAALAGLACVCLMAQLMTGKPVDWSNLPVRPSGWEPNHSTRSSRGCARARDGEADGGERKPARLSSAVLPGTAPLIGKLLSPPAPSPICAEPHPAPRRRWLDAFGIYPWQRHGWVTSRPRDPETRSRGQRDVR